MEAEESDVDDEESEEEADDEINELFQVATEPVPAADMKTFTWKNDDDVDVSLTASFVTIQKVIFDLTLLAMLKTMQESDRKKWQPDLTKYLLRLGKTLTKEEMTDVMRNLNELSDQKQRGPQFGAFMTPLLSITDFTQTVADNDNPAKLEGVRDLLTSFDTFRRPGWNNECTVNIPIIREGSCDKFKALWRAESNTTSYFIRYLAGSFMYNKGIVPAIVCNSDDPKLIKVTVADQAPTTIMGLGPSGCGKSFYPKLLFGKFEKVTTVMAIDGGIARSMSVIWVAASVLKRPDVFIKNISQTFSKVSKSKKRVFNLIKAQQVMVSLYVPDTLMSALSNSMTTSMDTYIAKYNYTKGDTVRMFIMQHCVECPRNCPFEKKYHCIGCDISGKKREITDGKKYSSTHYVRSIDLGYAFATRSDKCVFIHNSGRTDGTSIIAYKEGTFQDTTPLPNTLLLEMNFPTTYPELEKRLVQITQQTIQTPAGFVNKKKLLKFVASMTPKKGGRKKTRRTKLL